MRSALLPAGRSAAASGAESCSASSCGCAAHRCQQQSSPTLGCTQRVQRAARQTATPRGARQGNGLVGKSFCVSSIMPPMTPEEHLTLSPWEKCARFRRFPVKFVVQMLLVATCTLQALCYTNNVIPYFLDTDRTMRASFFGFDGHDSGRIDAVWSPPGNSGRWSAEISRTEDFRRSIQHLGQQYADFTQQSIDKYGIPGGQPLVRSQIEWRSGTETTGAGQRRLDTDLRFPPTDCQGLVWDDSVGTVPAALCSSFDINPRNTSEDGLGPFGSFDQWNHFFPRLQRLQLQIALTDHDASFLAQLGKSHCTVDWTVTAVYTVRSSGVVQVTYDTSARLTPQESRHDSISYLADAAEVFAQDDVDIIQPDAFGAGQEYSMWRCLCTGTMMLASLSFVLCVRALVSNLLNSRALAKYPDSLPYLRAQEKKRTSRAWLLMIILQNIVNIASAWQLRSPEKFSQDLTETDWMLAASVFLTLLNATRYLEWVSRLTLNLRIHPQSCRSIRTPS